VIFFKGYATRTARSRPAAALPDTLLKSGVSGLTAGGNVVDQRQAGGRSELNRSLFPPFFRGSDALHRDANVNNRRYAFPAKFLCVKDGHLRPSIGGDVGNSNV
jgi:hypothetical protein